MSEQRERHLVLEFLELIVFLLPVVFDFLLRLVFGVFYTLRTIWKGGGGLGGLRVQMLGGREAYIL